MNPTRATRPTHKSPSACFSLPGQEKEKPGKVQARRTKTEKMKNENRKKLNTRRGRQQKRAKAQAQRHGYSEKFRSKLELRTARILDDHSIPFEFEAVKLEWTPLPIPSKYTPDFRIVRPSDGAELLVETKGLFEPKDMLKMRAVKEQHPDRQILMCFQNPKNWHRAAKRRNYAKWCEEQGFAYCKWKDLADIINRWLKGGRL